MFKKKGDFKIYLKSVVLAVWEYKIQFKFEKEGLFFSHLI